MKISLDDMKKLSDLIYNAIREEFGNSDGTGNLIRSIKIELNEFGGINIDIPAEIYDSNYWEKFKVVKQVPGAGSYASQLDEYGKHKGFLDRTINNSIDVWLQLMSNKYKIINRKG